jgi:hypothetical protein
MLLQPDPSGARLDKSANTKHSYRILYLNEIGEQLYVLVTLKLPCQTSLQEITKSFYFTVEL